MPPPTGNYYDDDSEAAHSLDWRSLYLSLLEKSWVVVLCVAAAVFLTLGYIKRCPVIYEATAILQIDQEAPKPLPGVEGPRLPADNPETLKTIEKILQSRALLERVILSNNLAKDGRFVDPGEGEPSRERLVSRLAGMVSVKLQQGTRLLNVSVEHTDAKLTEQVANSLIHEFRLQSYELQSTMSDVTTEQLGKQAEELKKKLEVSRQNLQAYVEERNSVSLDERKDIVVQMFKDTSTKVNEAVDNRIRLQSEYDQVVKLDGQIQDLLGVKTIASDPMVSSAKIALNQAELDFSMVKQTKKERHLKYIEAENKIKACHDALATAVSNACQVVRNSFADTKRTEDDLRKRLKDQEALVIQLDKEKFKYNELQDSINSDKGLYETIVKVIKETSVVKGSELNQIRVVQRAYVPERPIKPNKKLILMAGIVAGFGIGMLLALGLAALDSSFKTSDQVETFLELPILTSIPQVRSLRSGKNQIIMTSGSEYLATEAFRTLRTTLSLLGLETARRIFLFTSAVPEEGKTFCALNFASSLAQQGLRTVLIEFDLRAPAVEAALVVEKPGLPGVSDCLLGQKHFRDVVRSTDQENFSYLPAGSRVPNPAELLAQDRVEALLKEALENFDRVVLDSAPLQPVSDTLLLVNRVQTVCLVVRANKTPRKLAQRAIQALQKIRAPLAGVIINRLSRSRRDPYYDYSYYSAYVESPAPKP